MANFDTPYDPNMRGVLFKNDQKGNPRAPLYRGSCVIDNVDFNISAWVLTAKKSGDKYMSLKFEAKRPAPPKAAPAMSEDNWSDLDTPF